LARPGEERRGEERRREERRGEERRIIRLSGRTILSALALSSSVVAELASTTALATPCEWPVAPLKTISSCVLPSLASVAT